MNFVKQKMSKLLNVLQTVQGWVIGVCVAIADYFAGHSFVVYLVTAVTLMDAGWGIAVSIRNGQFALSELARLTIDKVLVYGSVMFVFVGLDHFADTTVTASVVGAAIVLVELWSSCASMIILFPHIPLLKLLRKALAGEIAAKLHISPDEVEDALDGKEAANE